MPELEDHPTLQERIRKESAKYLTHPPEDGEFTRTQYMKWNGIEDKNTAYKALQEMEEDGIIYKRKGKLEGASVNVYGFKE